MSEQTATYTVTPQEIKDAVAMLGKGYKSEAANVAVRCTHTRVESCKMSVQEKAAQTIESLIVDLQGPDGKNPSREVALAVTKLQEARFWLMADYSA